MKKILSLLLCLSIVGTLMMGGTAFAAGDIAAVVSTDATTTEAVAFADYVENNDAEFDENYFFMSTFIMPFASQTNWDETKSDTLKIKLSTGDKSDKIDCIIGWYSYSEYAPGCIAADGQNVSLQTNNELVLGTNAKWYDQFKGIVDHSTETKTTYGVALKDVSQLTKETTFTLELISVLNNEETVVDSASYTFDAPVSFENEELADLADVLKDINNGKSVEAEAIKNALTKITSDDAKAELIEATKIADGEIEAKISDEIIGALVSALANDVTVTTTNTSTDNVKVTMPNAALATGSDVEIAIADAEQIKNVSVEDGETALNLDISIKKDGEVIQPLIPQLVEIELPADFEKNNEGKVKIYHKSADNSFEADIVDGKVTFVIDSFSVFTIVGDEIVITEDNMTKEVEVVIERKKNAAGEDTNVFAIGIKPSGVNAASTAIVNFVDATFGLKIESATQMENPMDNCSYELRAANGIMINSENKVEDNNTNTVLNINFLAQIKAGEKPITKGLGETVEIAEIEIDGLGAATLIVGGIDLLNDTENNVIYSEVDQNRAISAKLYRSSKNFNIELKKVDVNVEIEFANTLSDTKFTETDYLGMTVIFTNSVTGDIQEAVIGNGSDEDVNYLTLTYVDAEVPYSIAKGTVELIADNTYAFEVKGAGFRTYRGSILADKDKTINLWNNARHDKADGTVTSEEVVEDDGNPVYKNFLVGDIYMDGIVDIYDLSAVTSYYAPKKAVTDNKFATYDLNRDGYIDAADIAYVQVSYGN